MPRRSRCVLPGAACHVTQRGVDRRVTFSDDHDRHTYLRLLRENLVEADVRLLGWCLMTNHVHLVTVPAREPSLSILFRRVHGRYAQYYNARWGRSGHLWQSRFFGCVLGIGHLWSALAYVERNPVRAGMVEAAAEYPWSSAAAHLSGSDIQGILDMEWWRREAPKNWDQILRFSGVYAEPGSGAIFAYSINSDGTLTAVSPSPVATPNQPSAIAFSARIQ